MTDFSTRLRRATMVEHREAETRGFNYHAAIFVELGAHYPENLAPAA